MQDQTGLEEFDRSLSTSPHGVTRSGDGRMYSTVEGFIAPEPVREPLVAYKYPAELVVQLVDAVRRIQSESLGSCFHAEPLARPNFGITIAPAHEEDIALRASRRDQKRGFRFRETRQVVKIGILPVFVFSIIVTKVMRRGGNERDRIAEPLGKLVPAAAEDLHGKTRSPTAETGLVAHGVRASVKRDWDRRGLFVIAASHGTSDFYAGFVPLIVYYVASHNGLSPIFQGVAGFIWYLTSSIVQPMFGAYSDRYGRWWFLPAAVGVTTIGVSLAGLATTPLVLILLVVLGGFGSALMHPEAGRYSSMLSGSHKATGMSIFIIGGQIGYSIGPVLAAIALAHWRGGTAWLAIPGLCAVAALFWAMSHVGPRAEQQHKEARQQSIHVPRADRFGIALLVISTGLRQLVSSSFMIFLPNLLVGRGHSLVEAGQIVTLFLLVGVLGTYAGGRLGDRFGPLFVSIATLIAAVPFLLAFFTIPGPLGVLGLLAGSVLISANLGPGVALVQAMLPQNLGMALGLMNGVAFGVGSALVTGVGALVERAGPATALIVVSFVPLVSALSFAIVKFRRQAAPAPAYPAGQSAP
jgi:FSR family fosmidomycin resistance protein-like MFS transporter